LINIDVSNLEEAVSFYTRALGLRVGRRFGTQGVELSALHPSGQETLIYLLAKTSGTPPFDGAKNPRTYDRHWTPVHLDFVVDDIAEALSRATRAGASLEAGVSEHRWGKLAMLADPFGNGFCVLEFVGRGYDEIATFDEDESDTLRDRPESSPAASSPTSSDTSPNVRDTLHDVPLDLGNTPAAVRPPRGPFRG
jgi:catechol 2,3-dioxygenase-like lactoylglutathione lyase family enzyme